MASPRHLLLTQIRDGIEQIVLPELQPGSARTFLDLVTRGLNDLIAEESTLPGLRWELDATEAALLTEAQSLLKGANKPASACGASLGELEATLRTLLAGCSPDAPADLRRGALACFSLLVDAERRFRESLDPEVADGPASLFAKGDLGRKRRGDDQASASPVTAAALEAYLGRRGGDWRDARVLEVSLVPGGFGKETSIFKVARGHGVEEFVIRRDLPAMATNTTVAEEFPVLAAVFGAGIRVPEPMWLETDREIFGTPWMVLRRAGGSTDISGWRHRPDRVEAFLRALAEQLVMLHTLPLMTALTKGREHLTTRDWIAAEIAKSEELYLDRRSSPVPLLAAAYGWLYANIPESGISPRIIHGDVGFHNMLMSDGAIEAILDWEFVHIGDPQEELNYIRQFVEAVGSWPMFLEHYVACGGPHYRPDDAAFWNAWTGIRISTGCVGAWQAFSTGNFANPDAALKLAIAGLNFGPRHLLYAADNIVQAGRNTDE